MLYEDKFRGNISEETYRRLSKETEIILDKAQAEMNRIKESMNKEHINNNLKEYEDRIKELINIENPSRELLQTIISRIEIDQDRNI